MKIAFMLLAGLVMGALTGFADAQSPSVLLEACNAINDSRKRMACLKELMPTTPVKPAVVTPGSTAGVPGKVLPTGPLTLVEAVVICDRLLPGLVNRRDAAKEDTSLSTDGEMTVIWPSGGEGFPIYCNVSRTTRKVMSVTRNNKVISGSLIEDLDRRATEREEIRAGNYGPFVARAKEALTAAFKDPSSAQYQGLFLSGTDLPVLCGEINGKNSYGAYVGFRRFYATGLPQLNDVQKVNDSVFIGMWPSMCGNKIADVK